MSMKSVGSQEAKLQEIANFLSAIGMPSNEIKESLDSIVAEPVAIRKLNDRERDIYAGAVTRACAVVPAFRDAIAVIRPYYNAMTPTLYTDPHSRVGIGFAFFSSYLSPAQRAAMILHESMHVLYNHFARGAEYLHYPMIFNLAGDFEINSTLSRDSRVCFEHGVMPDQKPFEYPRDLSMEQYLALLMSERKDQERNHSDEGDTQDGIETPDGGSEGEGQPDTEGIAQGANGEDAVRGCDPSEEEYESQADDIGIERASTTEQNVVRSSTRSRIADELASRQYGSGSMHDLLSIANARMSPSRVRWQDILRKSVMRATDNIVRGGTDYSYRRVSRRHTNTDYIMPGMVAYQPSVLLGVDTSGSMKEEDYLKFLSEASDLVKRASRNSPMEYFCIDAEVQSPRRFRGVRDIKFSGGGGTDMSKAFEYVNSLSKGRRPDIFVLTTDGGTDWDECFSAIQSAPYHYYSVILVTDKDWVPRDATQRLGRRGKIIVVDDD